MKLVRDYLDELCLQHGCSEAGAPENEMNWPKRWDCAPCLLEMLPRLRAAARATCFGCSQDWSRPLTSPNHFFCGHQFPCHADETYTLIAEIEARLRGDTP